MTNQDYKFVLKALFAGLFVMFFNITMTYMAWNSFVVVFNVAWRITWLQAFWLWVLMDLVRNNRDEWWVKFIAMGDKKLDVKSE